MTWLARRLPERLQRPLASPDFRRLALGKTTSYLGDWLMVAVLVGWVYQSTASVAQVAVLMVIRMVPPIIGGGLAASLVDRLPRVRVLVWSEAACAATIGGALAGVSIGSRPLVFACVGLCGLAGMISTVAGNALLPATVDDDQLAAANSIHSIGQEAAMAIGAVLGGVTLATGGPTAGLAANLASYALALVLYLRIEIQPAAAATATRSARRAGLRDGLGYVLAHRSLTAIVGGFATVTLATGLVNATLPRFTTNLGLGPAGYGLALSVLATGMVAGEALTGALTDHIDPRWLSIGLAAMGVLFFAFAWSTNPTAALLLFALFGIANGFVEVVMMTGIHQHAERTHQGRVFGVGSTIWRTTTLGAVAAAPAINALASPAPTITLAGICLLAGAAAVCATLRRPVSDLATALT